MVCEAFQSYRATKLATVGFFVYNFVYSPKGRWLDAYFFSRFDKGRKMSQIFTRTEQIFVSARSFGVIFGKKMALLALRGY